MAVRVSPTEAIRAEIHELFASGEELLSVVEQVARLSVRLTFQSVIEEIVCEELGRGRYERRTGDSSEGYRNGWHQPRTLKTSLGPVELQRPKLRHALPEELVAQGGVGVAQLRALQRHRPGCGLQRAGLVPAVAVALRRVLAPALVAAAAQLLADDLLYHALEGQAHRQPRDLLQDAQQLAVGREQLVDLGAEGLGGRYSCCHGCRSPS